MKARLEELEKRVAALEAVLAPLLQQAAVAEPAPAADPLARKWAAARRKFATREGA